MVLELKKPRPIWEIVFSTHHTDIGLLYIMTSLIAFAGGGLLVMAIRSELFLPGLQLFTGQADFARFFTVHGTTMLFLWAVPFAAGVGNYLIPLMVRYKDMAWPKLKCHSILDHSSMFHFNMGRFFRYVMECLSSIFYIKSTWTRCRYVDICT